MDEETPSLTRKRDLMKQISMMREDESSTDEVHPTATPISRVETVNVVTYRYQGPIPGTWSRHSPDQEGWRLRYNSATLRCHWALSPQLFPAKAENMELGFGVSLVRFILLLSHVKTLRASASAIPSRSSLSTDNNCRVLRMKCSYWGLLFDYWAPQEASVRLFCWTSRPKTATKKVRSTYFQNGL